MSELRMESKTESRSIRFDFEDFLESVEEEFPEGVDSNYYSFIKVIQRPYRNILKLPKALLKLPINAVLFQPLSTIMKIYSIPVIISAPLFLISILASMNLSAGNPGVGIVFTIITMLGVIMAPLYLKNMFDSLSKMKDNKAVPWLVEGLQKSFGQYYNRRWSRTILLISVFIPLILEVQIVFSGIFSTGSIVYLVLYIVGMAVGHVGMTMVIFVNLMALYFVNANTKLYIGLLLKISQKVEGYTDGHESIVNKNTYEVVRVLADSPGLTVENLGNIPLISFFATILVVNGGIFLLGGPVLSAIIESAAKAARLDAIRAATVAGRTATDIREAGAAALLDTKKLLFTVIFTVALVISLFLSFTQSIFPIARISNKMVQFRTKALIELDQYIYEDLTSFALKREELEYADSATLNLFMLRQYIGTMRPTPVSPFRLIYFSLLFIIYASRIIPWLVTLFN